MKALVKKSTAPYDIGIVELDTPPLGDSDVLIKVTAGSICGSDLHMYLGHKGYDWIDYPVVPGHEVVGTVEAAGPGADPGLVGKRVVVNPYIPCCACQSCLNGEENICQAGPRTLAAPPLSLQFGFRRNGGMAEYMAVPGGNALPVGGEIPDVVAAMLESVAVGVHAVKKAGDVKGKNIVIFGPGPIGLGIATVCVGLGSRSVFVVGMPDDQKRLSIAEKIKAIPVVREDCRDLAGQLQNTPADFIFECSGSPSVPEQAIHLLKKGGEVILVGISANSISLPLDCVVRGEIGLRGTYGTSRQSYLQAIEYAGMPQFPFGLIVTHQFRLDEASTAFEHARSKNGKVIVYP